MKKGCSPANRGAALVLVLCFIVLLTALTVAYFSRTMVGRQLSNASTNAAQVSTVANSAVDVIVGDLKQEIANGGTVTVAGNNPTYTLGVNQTANAVPQRNAAPAASATGSSIPNLVRRSARGDATNGNTTDYVPSPAVPSRASAVSSTARSLNGRYVSLARWNLHYLIPTITPTASMPPTTPIADFHAPDWVYVTAEKGPSVLNAPTKDAGGNPVTVTGRYAYAIYDEGGLLDMNHTGYPSASRPEHTAAKLATGYADLTQLPWRDGTVGKLTAANVDSLLAWRQYATLQATGNYPDTLQPNGSQEAAYYGLFTTNSRSLMQVPLAYWNNRTDQTFLSRQQLINFFTTAAKLPSSSPAKLDPWYLQYLGTFNRSLNQPSYAPETNRPQVAGLSSGGNDSNNNTFITPNFLAAVVLKDFDRFSGVTPSRHAFANEPLVKQRFPLNRLAWLTYKGPSQTRNLGDPDMQALINNYGITADYLQQGTETNIEYYFGLRWTGSYWTYIHGTNGANGAILNISNPNKPIDVVHLTGTNAREPDFFELLKASINPGSIAKTSISPSIQRVDSTGGLDAAQAQYTTDSSLDTAIVQIGANIIDQFDTDGFPTRIDFDLVGSGQFTRVYGDENLPYISQVRSGLIRLAPANPTEVGAVTTASIKDTGLAALMNLPEVWNPHGWSSTNLDASVGVTGAVPSKFKIYAETPTYPNDPIPRANHVYVWSNSNPFSFSYDADRDRSPGYLTKYGFQWGVDNGGPPNTGSGGEPRTLSETNTQMTFAIGHDTTSAMLFREPTILYRPGFPSGSNLASTALVFSKNDNTNLGYLVTGSANNQVFFSTSPGGGLLSGVSAPTADQDGFTIPTSGAAYVGFYLGSHPLRWWDDNVGAQPGSSIPAYQTEYGRINEIKYTLACDDGNNGWILYDSKAVSTSGEPDASLYSGSDAGFGLNGTAGVTDGLDYGLRYFPVVDPRTSRFGMVDPWVSSNQYSIPPRGGYSYANPSAGDGSTRGAREDISSGEAWYFGYAAGDWYDASMGWYHGNGSYGLTWLRPGLLSQNDPHWPTYGNIASTALPDGSNVSGSFPPFYYADADGMVRRASGGGFPDANVPTKPDGLPMAYAKGTINVAYSSGGNVQRQMDSRPVILNRPFRSVAELGYVFSGTPWKNLDFFLPESGDVAMLDVFCINDSSDSQPLAAGQVNLNTHQVPVIQATLAGAIKDLWYEKDYNSASFAGFAPDLTILNDGVTHTLAQQLANLLVQRTAGPTGSIYGPNANKGPQPLQNISDLVGRWVQSVPLSPAANSNATPNAGYDGRYSYDGFTTDLVNVATVSATDRMRLIQRFGESAVRALANVGQTRVWNLMFDIVAQTGRFPTQAQALVKPGTATNAGAGASTDQDQFNVEGEQHYWVHVAIDRCTGQVVDKQVEVVTE